MDGNNLIKKGIAVAVILLFVSVSVIPSTALNVVEKSSLSTLDGNTLYVGGNGPGNYSKIQDAINDAWYGDTVFVYDDSSPYYENLQIKRGINLVGEDKNTTVIDGDECWDSIIKVQSDDVTVSGFTIRNLRRPPSNFHYSNIHIVDQQNITISDNIISMGDLGHLGAWIAAIYFRDSCNCFILNNYIFEEQDMFRSVGIVLYDGSSNNLISGNTISGNYTKGIYTLHSCHNNIISGNYIHHNMEGIHIYGTDNEVINNRIVNSSSIGIYIVDGVRNTVSGNIISHNIGGLWDGGIVILASNRNIISDNEISYNHPTGVYVSVAYNNVISGNNFIDNEGEGHKEGGNAYFNYNGLHFFANRWNENYWSDSLSGGIRPKIIHGEVLAIFDLPWINFDWRPALKPYDIDVGDSTTVERNVNCREGVGGYVK